MAQAKKGTATQKATTKPAAKATAQRLDDAASRRIRLASAKPARIAEWLRTEAGLRIPKTRETDKAWLVEKALAAGWGWKGNVVDPAKKAAYGAAQHCDDDVANVLAHAVRSINPETKVDFLDLDKVRAVAKQNGISLDRWMHLNIGQIRMNFGNVLRGKVRRGEEVRIGDKVWNADQE